jgi:hypothetical protein
MNKKDYRKWTMDFKKISNELEWIWTVHRKKLLDAVQAYQDAYADSEDFISSTETDMSKIISNFFDSVLQVAKAIEKIYRTDKMMDKYSLSVKIRSPPRWVGWAVIVSFVLMFSTGVVIPLIALMNVIPPQYNLTIALWTLIFFVLSCFIILRAVIYKWSFPEDMDESTHKKFDKRRKVKNMESEEIEKMLKRIEEEIRNSKDYTYAIGAVGTLVSLLIFVIMFYATWYFSTQSVPLGAVIIVISCGAGILFLVTGFNYVVEWIAKKRREQ